MFATPQTEHKSAKMLVQPYNHHFLFCFLGSHTRIRRFRSANLHRTNTGEKFVQQSIPARETPAHAAAGKNASARTP